MYILDIDKNNGTLPIVRADMHNGISNNSEMNTDAAISSASKSNADNVILSASKINTTISAAKTAFTYMLLAIFCALFGGVYECFSHDVYSFSIIYAFAFPLAGGSLPFFTIFLIKAKFYPCAFARNLYHSGIATLTAGSFIRGVLDIYGTTNGLIKYYSIAGIALVVTGIFIYALQICMRRK